MVCVGTTIVTAHVCTTTVHGATSGRLFALRLHGALRQHDEVQYQAAQREGRSTRGSGAPRQNVGRCFQRLQARAQ